MEPRGCNRWQPAANRPVLETAKTSEIRCHRLPPVAAGSNGNEGVDGSSPSEGSAKAPEIGAFSFGSTCRLSNVGQVWSPLWSLQVEKRESGSQTSALVGCIYWISCGDGYVFVDESAEQVASSN